MVAAVASQIEQMKLPLKEIRKRFTKSEICIMAWRSGEVAHNMRSTMQRTVGDAKPTGRKWEPPPVVSDPEIQLIEERMGGLADKLCEIEDEHGIDMSKLTGAEAMRFLSSMGVSQGRTTANDDVTDAYRGIGYGR